MTYIVYQDGNEINRIAAGESFIQTYCEENGYTYEQEVTPESEPTPEQPTELEQLRADVDYIAAMTGVDLV